MWAELEIKLDAEEESHTEDVDRPLPEHATHI